MKLFAAEFKGVWLGGHAVVVAANIHLAKIVIMRELREAGFPTSDDSVTLTEIPMKVGATILFNGDY